MKLKKIMFYTLAIIMFLLTINGALAETLFSDNFDDGDISDWTTVGSVAVDGSVKYAGAYSVKFTDAGAGKEEFYQDVFVSNKAEQNVSFYVRSSETDASNGFHLVPSTEHGTNIGMTMQMSAVGTFQYHDGTSWANMDNATSYVANTWYKIDIIVNFSQNPDIFDIYIDGIKVCAGCTDSRNFAGMDRFHVNTPNTADVNFWLDEVLIHNNTPAPPTSTTINVYLKDILSNTTVNEYNVSLYKNGTGLIELNETFDGLSKFTLNSTGNYTIVLNYANSYSYANVSNQSFEVAALGGATTKTFYAYRENSVYFTFYEELTKNLLTGQDISIVINNDDYVYENTTINNSVFFIDNLTAGEYKATFSAATYLERFYIFTVGAGSTQSIDLYLINTTNSDPITVNLKTNTGDIVSEAIIKLLRYYSDINAYTTVEMTQTNFDGDGILQVQLASATDSGEFYKFIIEVDDIVYLETTPSKISDTTLNFIVNLAGETIPEYKESLSLAYDLSFTSASNNFKFTFSNGQGIFIGSCIYVYQYVGLTKTLYNSSCLNSTAGTLLVNIDNSSTNTYVAEAYATYTGVNHYLGSLTKKFDSAALTFGKSGAFFAGIIVIMFALIGIYSPIIAIILTLTGLTFTMLFGIIPLNWGVLVGLISGGLILVWINKA